VYRELVGREVRAVAQWERQYGAEALLRKPDPREMQNLGKFEKFAAMPMPLEVQLQQLKQQRVEQAAEIVEFERKNFPKRAIYPVSALSVSIYGDAAWHTQKPDGRTPPGHPGTYEPLRHPKPEPYNAWNKFNCNGTLYDRVSMGAVHVRGRNKSRAQSARARMVTEPKLTTPVAHMTKPSISVPVEAW